MSFAKLVRMVVRKGHTGVRARISVCPRAPRGWRRKSTKRGEVAGRGGIKKRYIKIERRTE